MTFPNANANSLNFFGARTNSAGLLANSHRCLAHWPGCAINWPASLAIQPGSLAHQSAFLARLLTMLANCPASVANSIQVVANWPASEVNWPPMLIDSEALLANEPASEMNWPAMLANSPAPLANSACVRKLWPPTLPNLPAIGADLPGKPANGCHACSGHSTSEFDGILQSRQDRAQSSISRGVGTTTRGPGGYDAVDDFSAPWLWNTAGSLGGWAGVLFSKPSLVRCLREGFSVWERSVCWEDRAAITESMYQNF